MPPKKKYKAELGPNDYYNNSYYYVHRGNDRIAEINKLDHEDYDHLTKAITKLLNPGEKIDRLITRSDNELKREWVEKEFAEVKKYKEEGYVRNSTSVYIVLTSELENTTPQENVNDHKDQTDGAVTEAQTDDVGTEARTDDTETGAQTDGAGTETQTDDDCVHLYIDFPDEDADD